MRLRRPDGSSAAADNNWRGNKASAGTAGGHQAATAAPVPRIGAFMSKKKQILLTVDRIEADQVILAGKNEKTAALPRSWLPTVSEGDIISARFIISPQKTETARNDLQALIDELNES